MSSEAGDASSDDFPVGNTKIKMVDITFSEANHIHPWKTKTRAEQWMQKEVLNASIRTQDAKMKKLLFRRGS